MLYFPKKKIVIVHPYLPITATSPQRPLSSVPKVAVGKRFNCIVCTAYENFYRDGPPIPKRSPKKAVKLILQENSFQFNERNYLQTHGIAMGTKMAVAFANIFMAEIETQIRDKSANKPLVWKRYIDDIITSRHASRHLLFLNGDGYCFAVS